MADRRQISFYCYFIGLILLVISMPLSKFGMSISQFMIAFGWVLAGDYKNRIGAFFSNRMALLLSSLFLLHLIGLAWTTDFDYAFKDLRIKLPLLLMPFLLATFSALSRQQFETVLHAVIGGVVVSTLISLAIYLGIINRPVNDIRDISIFISHIRLVLICCMAVFIAAWLMFSNRNQKPVVYHGLMIAVMIWLSFFVFFIQGLTGMVILTLAFIIVSLAAVFFIRALTLKLLFLAVAVAFVYHVVSVHYEVKELMEPRLALLHKQKESLTKSGNAYVHDETSKQFENGYPVWIYVCEEELRAEWNKRSGLDYDGRDQLGQELRVTLIRFLSSKGLRKDSASLAYLNNDEIRAVESGTANVYYLENDGLSSRLHRVMWEIENYRNGGDPSGHSVAQRLEYWKAAIGIIRENPLLGVGTGDVPGAFSNQYEKTRSLLDKQWRLRSHNQYLSVGVAFGLVGLLWFLVILTVPLVSAIRYGNWLFAGFSLIAMVSMLTEDTLETQAGVTFYAFFSALFLIVYPQKGNFRGNQP